MFPVRCFTCGKVLSWKRYERFMADMKGDVDNALDKMNVIRMCCRRMYISHVPKLEEVIYKYDKYCDFKPKHDE